MIKWEKIREHVIAQTLGSLPSFRVSYYKLFAFSVHSNELQIILAKKEQVFSESYSVNTFMRMGRCHCSSGRMFMSKP